MNVLNSDTMKEQGIALLRVAVGLVFFMHGWQKLFMFGFAGVAGFFEQLGIPFPMVAGVAVTLIELLGGAALILGLYTRWVSIPLAVVMFGALISVHPAGFFLPDGYEFVLTLLAASIGLSLTGAGAFSVDGWLANRQASASAFRREPSRA